MERGPGRSKGTGAVVAQSAGEEEQKRRRLDPKTCLPFQTPEMVSPPNNIYTHTRTCMYTYV